MGAFLKDFVSNISEIALIPSDAGRYEISVNDELIYSKAQTGQHIEPPQVLRLFEEYLKEKA